MKEADIFRLLLLWCTVASTESISAVPFPVNVTLPNGKVVTTKLKGDEFLSWQTDLNDYTVVPGNDGFLYYGVRTSNGKVGSSGARVDQSSPPYGISKNILPTAAAYQAECQGKYCGNPGNRNNVFSNRYLRSGADEATDPQQQLEEQSPHTRKLASPTTGNVLNLLIPICFSDHRSRALPSKAQLTVLMNNIGPDATLCPTGSVRDVYKYNSYGKLNLTTVVADWVYVSNTEKYYANGNRGLTTLTHTLIREALSLADPSINFAQFDSNRDSYIDAITFVHSGYGAEWGGTGYLDRIWSHKWSLYTGAFTSSEGVKVFDYHISPALWGTSGSNIGRIGVIAHETGHFFGLPDMYDGTSGQGVGSFDLMGNSWGFRGDQYYPPHMSLFTRIAMGWDTAVTISTNGVYYVAAVGIQSPVYPRGYKITKNFPAGEYLLIENRHQLLFDAAIPVNGLVIYHVDENANYTSEGYPGMSGYPLNHYKVAVLAPDGRYDLEKGANRGDAGDLWVAGSAGITWSQNADPSLGPNYPNTDAYQGGNLYKSYIQISNIYSPGGTLMSFTLKIGAPTPAPVTTATAPVAPSPVKQPTLKPATRPPTKRPVTRPPTKKPATRPPTKRPVTRPPTRKPFTCLRSGATCSANNQCCSFSCRSKKGKLTCA